MTQFTIWIVSPPGYAHSHAFDEVAVSLCEGLKEIGHECGIATSSFECRGKVIILGANLLTSSASFIETTDFPTEFIIFNLEQIIQGSPWLTKDYVELLQGKRGDYYMSRHHCVEVWDYSRRNIEVLKELGVEAKLCEIGYVPALTHIGESDKRSDKIDVLFYGSLNPRRIKILEGLYNRGQQQEVPWNIVNVCGVYGTRRDEFIARAKLVLNLHFYEPLDFNPPLKINPIIPHGFSPNRAFEIVRCGYLMANRKCVVSEVGEDVELERPYRDGIAFCRYDELVERCEVLLGDEEMRENIARRGFEIFSAKSQAEILRGLI